MGWGQPCTRVQESGMQERRRVERTRVLKGAKIIFNNRSSLFDATVIDLTDLGAGIYLSYSVGIPGSFILSVDFDYYSCRVIWRTENQIGVAFG
jgi:hypothetical protein